MTLYETYGLDAMPAGRELDALVAEKIFEWKFQPGGRGVPPHWVTPDGRVVPDHALPEFSRRIEVAWEVWQKVGGGIIEGNDEDGYTIAECCSGQIDVALVGGKYGKKGWNDEPTTHAPTAPLAICRAALRSVSGSKQL